MNELYDDYDELDDYNPEGLQLVEVAEKPKKRKRRKNPEPTTIAMATATPVLLLIAGYLGWCAYASKSGLWSWQPWKKLAGRPRLQLRRTNPNATEAERQARQQAQFDRAIEESLKPSVVTIDTVVPWRPVYADTEKERVSFIVP